MLPQATLCHPSPCKVSLCQWSTCYRLATIYTQDKRDKGPLATSRARLRSLQASPDQLIMRHFTESTISQAKTPSPSHFLKFSVRNKTHISEETLQLYLLSDINGKLVGMGMDVWEENREKQEECSEAALVTDKCSRSRKDGSVALPL